jgi:hypothetical protein
VRALILSAVNPDNTPHGYNWTFVFPMLLFIVIALILWALFGRPHQRVPARRLAAGLSMARGGASGSPHEPAAAQATASADSTGAGEAEDGGGETPADDEPAGGSAPGAAGS